MPSKDLNTRMSKSKTLSRDTQLDTQLTVNARPGGMVGESPEFQASLGDTVKPCHKRKQNPNIAPTEQISPHKEGS